MTKAQQETIVAEDAFNPNCLELRQRLTSKGVSMFVLHIALQGALRGRDVEYGVTADTGGHIRYLLGLVDASQNDDDIEKITVATRSFESDLGEDYMRPHEVVTPKIDIIRLPTTVRSYLPKEELWHEVPSFAGELIAWIKNQPRRPDILHAHYADAGVVASIVRDELGIPFVFTAHSLGRVKMDAFKNSGEDVIPDSTTSLEKRVLAEERALTDASLIIASSRDEAEHQYADYRSYDPGRIRVVPPGSELSTFAGAKSNAATDRAINRFLKDPDKPALLAIARPVAKKNLAALAKAYGKCPELQAIANLVIVAGTRKDLQELEPEIASSLQKILYLVDRYDLYGKAAYPKEHHPDDVPSIYAYARERRGIFVNPAFNEPFGLTLLEAAAVGLPVIATDSGGPNDIIELCRNGELVDPHSATAIAEAALRILTTPGLWEDYAAAGVEAVLSYDWPSHVRKYHRLIRSLTARQIETASDATQLLVCDIDNTLVGSKEAIRAFIDWRERQAGLTFGVATGRSFHSAMAVLEQENAPFPEVMITSVGSEIYHRRADRTTYKADAEWAAYIDTDWRPEEIKAALAGEPTIRPQAALEQRRFKISYLTTGDAGVVQQVRARLNEVGLACSLIHSHGRYLDILPVRASKGSAVEHVRKLYGLSADEVCVAGDSGNDIEMLRDCPQAIIVKNFSDNLMDLPELRHGYFASQTHAHGVIEGVSHFRQLRQAASPVLAS